MPHWVLTSDWSEYEARKENYDERYIYSCEESWEVDYLVIKIMNFNRELLEEEIKAAIYCSCKKIKAPRSRAVFVISVMERLRVSLENITRIHSI